LLAGALLAGCQEKSNPPANAARPVANIDPEERIKASLANLDPEDRRLAEAQKYCPIMPKTRLGEMGTPHKEDVEGASLFVCCKSCVRQIRKNPEKAHAALNKVKEQTANK
jgi:hypothetical protein